MTILLFDGEEDAYWWILCLEKFFKEHETPKSLKVLKAVGALRGSAFTWWIWWCRVHPRYNWDTFTTALLWRFKPEWRPILPLDDEDEEPPYESTQSFYSTNISVEENPEEEDDPIVESDLKPMKPTKETYFHEDLVVEPKVVHEIVQNPSSNLKQQVVGEVQRATTASLLPPPKPPDPTFNINNSITPPQFSSELVFLEIDDNPFEPWEIPASLKDSSLFQNFSANNANVKGCMPNSHFKQGFDGDVNFRIPPKPPDSPPLRVSTISTLFHQKQLLPISDSGFLSKSFPTEFASSKDAHDFPINFLHKPLLLKLESRHSMEFSSFQTKFWFSSLTQIFPPTHKFALGDDFELVATILHNTIIHSLYIFQPLTILVTDVKLVVETQFRDERLHDDADFAIPLKPLHQIVIPISSSVFLPCFSKQFIQQCLDKEDEEVIIVEIDNRADILFHLFDFFQHCSLFSEIWPKHNLHTTVDSSMFTYVNDTGSFCGLFQYLYGIFYAPEGICFPCNDSNFGEDISVSTHYFGVWLKSDIIRDHLDAHNSRSSFTVEKVGTYVLISNNLRHATLEKYWFHEQYKWRFGTLNYVVCRKSLYFAYKHKELDIAIHQFNVWDCLDSVLIIATELDTFEIYLAVLLAKNLDMENQHILHGSFANAYLFMKPSSLKFIFQLYQLVSMTADALDTFLQSNINGRIFVVLGAYSTEHELECNNHNLLPIIVSIVSQVVYFFMILRLDSGHVILRLYSGHVLTVTQLLRKHRVVGKFVEFYGQGLSELPLADCTTIANMSPEIGRSYETVPMIESYLPANKMFVDYSEPQVEIVYSSYLELNLEDVEPCVSCPKRPCVILKEMKEDWHACLNNKVEFKGFDVEKEAQTNAAELTFCETLIVLNDIHINIMEYIAPASCVDMAFRTMWAKLEWESKVAVNTVLQDERDFFGPHYQVYIYEAPNSAICLGRRVWFSSCQPLC